MRDQVTGAAELQRQASLSNLDCAVDEEATLAFSPLDVCAAANGAAGPATIAVARAAEMCFLRVCSRLPLIRSALRLRERASECSQSSGWARSL
jgi:hypothetical protein